MVRPYNKQYVIGVDGGGSKTEAILGNLKGEILARATSGPSNLNKIGLERACNEICSVLLKVSRGYKNKIVSTYIALAGSLQRNPSIKERVKNALRSDPKVSFIFRGKIVIESDEKAALKAGTDKKEGIVLISGAGSICYGRKEKREEQNLGWDYLLGDEGSGFWIGQQALRAVCKAFDNRGPKTLLSNLVFKKLKIKDEQGLIRKIYTPRAVETIASLSSIVNIAAKKNDKTSKIILTEAGKELGLAMRQIIERLNLEREKFPIVLVGGTFNSTILLTTIKSQIKKIAPKAEFIRPKKRPVIGSFRLALENVK